MIAFVLAAIGNAIGGYLLQVVSELREQVHDLETQVAVLDERMNYLAVVAGNTQSYSGGNGRDEGSYNAAEGNASKGS